MSNRVISDSPVKAANGKEYGRKGYLLPIAVCASCGQRTNTAFHATCKRVDGRLVVKR